MVLVSSPEEEVNFISSVIPVSALNDDNIIELSSSVGSGLGFRTPDLLIQPLISQVRPVQKVFVEPVKEDDWEILVRLSFVI